MSRCGTGSSPSRARAPEASPELTACRRHCRAASGRRSWRPSGASTSRSGTSRASTRACRSGGCWGGEPRPIPTYATGGYYRPGAPDKVYAEELAGFVQAGYRAVKLKTGAGSPADEARRVRTVREAIGKDISLMLDMNAPYDVDGCIEFARRVEPLDIYWLEEPLHWYLQPADFVRLAAATSIPLAHGERELTRFTVRDFIATGAIRYVQFDSTRAAGFTEGLRVAALAEQHAVMIAPHTAPELHAHLVAALPRCGFGVESHGDAARNPLSHHLLVGGPETRDSCVHLNDKPGFGVEIDWDYAKRYAA